MIHRAPGRDPVLRSIVALLLVLISGAATAQQYHLPFEGRWFALQAGDTPNVNQHMTLRAQWFGIDFGKLGGPSGRALVRTNGATVEDFYCWGADVLAPVDGTVTGIIDDLPDLPVGQKDPAHALGNHFVIQAAPDQFVYLAHFQRGSVAVKPVQAVKSGERVGRCGNSGNTDFPHVHMHVQDSAVFDTGQGRNIVFSGIDVELAGKRFTNVDWPMISGLFIRNH
jgi:hypothetical protein